MNKTIAGIVTAGALVLGGTADVIPTTPYEIDGTVLYDTPSGTLDAGFFVVDAGVNLAHLPIQLTATTTLPDGYYPVKDTTGLTLAHVVGTRWMFLDSARKVIGTSDDQTIGAKLITKDAPLPTVDVSVASLVL